MGYNKVEKEIINNHIREVFSKLKGKHTELLVIPYEPMKAFHAIFDTKGELDLTKSFVMTGTALKIPYLQTSLVGTRDLIFNEASTRANLKASAFLTDLPKMNKPISVENPIDENGLFSIIECLTPLYLGQVVCLEFKRDGGVIHNLFIHNEEGNGPFINLTTQVLNGEPESFMHTYTGVLSINEVHNAVTELYIRRKDKTTFSWENNKEMLDGDLKISLVKRPEDIVLSSVD